MPAGFKTCIAAVLVFLPWLSGCSTMSYYAQSIEGHLEIMHRRTAIDTLLAKQELPAATLTQLAEVNQIRKFAVSELGLPDSNSYRDYADINRKYAVWNVYAAPELSLASHQWCFPFIGCQGYRGYFSREDADNYAAALAEKGYDVFIGGVTAYSTLGWFADPVLNTMLRHDRVFLARTIFHELAHQKLFIAGDTEFNEAFADTVATAGVGRWLETHGTAAEKQAYAITRLQEETFINIVLQYRDRLGDMYQSGLDDADKRNRKHTLLAEMTAAYRQRPGNHAYTAWFAEQLNNAKLASVTTYRDYAPGFEKLLAVCGDNLLAFYERVEHLRTCSKEQRRHILRSGRVAFTC